MQMWEYFPFPRIHVFTSQKKAAKYIKRSFGREFIWAGKNAQVDYFNKAGEESQAVITINFGNESPEQRVAMLAHQCSHIIDEMSKDLDNTYISPEIRACAMQSAMLACLNQLGDKWLTRQAKHSSEK